MRTLRMCDYGPIDKIMARRIARGVIGVNVTIQWVIRRLPNGIFEGDGDIIEKPIEIAG